MAAHVEEFPELSTTDHWRAMMKRSRKAARISQLALGKKVGVSQNVISGIETGKLRASSAILPICDLLKIPPPQVMFEDAVEQRWVETGRRLRALGPALFEAQLEGAERMVASLSRQRTEH